jgi:hypothetical protein
MKYVVSLSFLLCATILMAQPISDAEKTEGFKGLFDGRSFEGWKTSEKTPSSWKIEDGILILMGGRTHLFTNESYENFVIRFEWRAEKKGYNSGFYLRGTNQIQMQQQNCGQFMPSKKTKGVPDLHKAPGEWNEWEVTCDGPKVSLKVNGKLAWETDDFRATKGPLGIEAEGSRIDFRNLRIKILDKQEDKKDEKKVDKNNRPW